APIAPNASFPNGMAGMLLIESEPGMANVYLVTPQVDGTALVGWRLTKPDGTVYNLQTLPTGLHCDCPESTYRRPCRHVKALEAVRSEIIDHERPAHRSAAEAAEHAGAEWDGFDPAA